MFLCPVSELHTDEDTPPVISKYTQTALCDVTKGSDNPLPWVSHNQVFLTPYKHVVSKLEWRVVFITGGQTL